MKLIFITLIFCTLYFRIRLLSNPLYVANIKGKIGTSELYSPAKFIFTDGTNNNITMVDSETNYAAETVGNKMKEMPVKPISSQEFKIVLSGLGGYYIMQGGSCLQLNPEENVFALTKIRFFDELVFGPCLNENEKLFEVRFDADHIKLYDHIVVRDNHHGHHAHYYAFDNYCGHQNCNDEKTRHRLAKDLIPTIGHGHEVYINSDDFYLLKSIKD